MRTMMQPEPIRLTYAEFCAVPDDGRRYELLDGVLSRRPICGRDHQATLGNLMSALHRFCRRTKVGTIHLGPLDVLLSEHDIIEPDIIFVFSDRASIITDRNIQGVPDLLVEVLSPSSIERDTRDKRNIYARCGVKNYWLVDPVARTVTELELIDLAYVVAHVTTGADVFRPRLFPGLEVQPTDLWE